MQKEGKGVLVVEDDPALRNLAAEVLGEAGWEVVVLSGPPSMDVVRARRPAALVLDWRIEDETVDPFLEQLRADPELQSLPVVIWSGSDVRGVADTLRARYSPIEIVLKPSVVPELPDALTALLRR